MEGIGSQRQKRDFVLLLWMESPDDTSGLFCHGRFGRGPPTTRRVVAAESKDANNDII